MRRLGWFFFLSFACFAATDGDVIVRGTIRVQSGKPTVVETNNRKRIELTGDEEVTKVLNDARLDQTDFEAHGRYIDSTHFRVNDFHKHELMMYRDGKRFVVSYWCDVCYLRTYTPGKCVCCQKETDLDPEDPSKR